MIRTLVALALAGAVVGGQAQAQTAPAKAKPVAMKSAGKGAMAAYHAPRGPDGKHPDLNGVWQAMNTANYNIEPHASSAALQMRPGPVVPVPAKDVLALGAVGSVPAGLGVVEGHGQDEGDLQVLGGAVGDINAGGHIDLVIRKGRKGASQFDHEGVDLRIAGIDSLGRAFTAKRFQKRRQLG